MATILICTSQPAVSESSHQSYQAPLSKESLLLDISKLDNGTLISVGERGHVLLSDNGTEWRQQNVPTTATLTAVYFEGEKGWAVGHDSVILHSEDYGISWQLQQYLPELQKPLMDVLFFDSQNGVAIGAYGSFLRTVDGGKNWISEPHIEFLSEDDQLYLEDLKAEDESLYQQELAGILPHLNRINLVDGVMYLAGEMGLLAKSDNQGKSWQKMDIDYFGSFFDINLSSSGSIVAAGLRGNVFEYQNDISGWRKINNDSTSSYNSIVTAQDQGTVVVGNNGRLLWLGSDDLTLTQTQEGKAIINAVFFNGTLLAVTEQGIKTFTRNK